MITIFHDEERFLADAIESVLAQTVDDWELLLVDDGSRDRSSAIARDFAQRYPGRIRYLEHAGHARRGMSASRNLGLHHAHGEYVAFLDGDDVYLPQRLERHLDMFESMPDLGVVQSDLIHWQSWRTDGGRMGDDYVRPSVCFTDRVVPAPLALWTLVAVPSLSPGICSLTVRRSVALAVGGFEEQFESLYEDQVFLTRLYASQSVYVIEDYLAAYRIHPESAVERARMTAMDPSGAWQVQRRAFMDWRSTYLRSLPDASGLLRSIVAEAECAAAAGPAGPLARLRARFRVAVDRVLCALPADRLVRATWAWRRRRADRRTRESYAELCQRVHRVIDQQAGERAA